MESPRWRCPSYDLNQLHRSHTVILTNFLMELGACTLSKLTLSISFSFAWRKSQSNHVFTQPFRAGSEATGSGCDSPWLGCRNVRFLMCDAQKLKNSQ